MKLYHNFCFYKHSHFPTFQLVNRIPVSNKLNSKSHRNNHPHKARTEKVFTNFHFFQIPVDYY